MRAILFPTDSTVRFQYLYMFRLKTADIFRELHLLKKYTAFYAGCRIWMVKYLYVCHSVNTKFEFETEFDANALLLKNLHFSTCKKIAESTKHTLIQARLARWLIDMAWCCQRQNKAYSTRYTTPPSRACCARSLARYFKISVSLWTAYV